MLKYLIEKFRSLGWISKMYTLAMLTLIVVLIPILAIGLFDNLIHHKQRKAERDAQFKQEMVLAEQEYKRLKADYNQYMGGLRHVCVYKTVPREYVSDCAYLQQVEQVAVDVAREYQTYGLSQPPAGEIEQKREDMEDGHFTQYIEKNVSDPKLRSRVLQVKIMEWARNYYDTKNR